eukprot:COSAG04_NODE_224_length_19624_cov_47.932855_10_plen_215_part_00
MSHFDRPSAPPAHSSTTSPRRDRPTSLHVPCRSNWGLKWAGRTGPSLKPQKCDGSAVTHPDRRLARGQMRPRPGHHRRAATSDDERPASCSSAILQEIMPRRAWPADLRRRGPNVHRPALRPDRLRRFEELDSPGLRPVTPPCSLWKFACRGTCSRRRTLFRNALAARSAKPRRKAGKRLGAATSSVSVRSLTPPLQLFELEDPQRSAFVSSNQ